jgi:hypothetical protein
MGRNGRKSLKRKLPLLWYVRLRRESEEHNEGEMGVGSKKADEQEEPEPPKSNSKPESKPKARPESKAVTKPESKPKTKPESEIKAKETDKKVRRSQSRS